MKTKKSEMETKKKIVVMGGSFNPPTLAHYKLMREAIDAQKAEIGFFVPVSDAYLKRKMRRCHPPVVLSPELRVEMLEAMCTDARMQVYVKEIGTIEARTMPTLMAIQEEYPDADIWFVMGDDKLSLLDHLTEKRDFLDAFGVVLYAREDGAIEQTLKQDEVLSRYLNRIAILPPPVGIDTISSSRIRERMLAGESSEDMLYPAVWELFKGFTAADFPDVINQFKDEYDFLSNRYCCHFKWQGLQYGSAEAAFQASKCKDESERRFFASCSVNKAVVRGKDIVPYADWEDARLYIMESILRAKFEQNPTLMQKLVDTKDCVLINGNNKQDTFWGIDLYSWIGENHLGQLLMKIRKSL